MSFLAADIDQYKLLLQQQKHTLTTAESRAGQKPSTRRSRGELEAEFARAAMRGVFMTMAADAHWVRHAFVGKAYPPCTRTLQELKPMKISDLRLETHHRGRVLIVRTFCRPFRIQSVQNAVEDEIGAVERLAFYNADPSLDPERVLPESAVFAIKEPYYKVTSDGGTSVRVDHPSDLMRLADTHPMVPDALLPRLVELEKDALSYKNEGNAAFTEKDYLAACRLYTRGIELCTAGEKDFLCDLHRNRSLMNTHLKRFEAAKADGLAAFHLHPTPDFVSDLTMAVRHLELGTSQTVKNNVKALYRTGRAAYELGEFSEAKEHYEHALRLAADVDAQTELTRTRHRIAEQETGQYSFSNPTKKVPRLDHASFLSNTCIKHTGDACKGRGLFAAKNVKAGEVIMVEKAFCACFESDTEREELMIINPNTGRGTSGSHAALLFSIVQKLLYSPRLTAQYLKLYAGKQTVDKPPVVVDGVTVVDSFHVQAIIEHNCFGIPGLRASDDFVEAVTKPKNEHERESSGIWLQATYMNYACNGNAARSYIGDLMIVRATKDIAAGEELTTPYRPALTDVQELQTVLERQWGFKCQCTICAAERHLSANQRKKLQALLEEARKFIKTNQLTMQTLGTKAAVGQAEALMKKLEAAHNIDVYHEGVPRIGLVDLGLWLAQAYGFTSTQQRVRATSLDVLRNLGYRIDGGQVDRGHGVLVRHAIDVAMYVAHSYYVDGSVSRGKPFEALAKEFYQTLHGELRGFEKRYE